MVLGKSTEGATVIPRATQLMLTVQFALESVSRLPWNHCPDSLGIGVQFGVEYAAAAIRGADDEFDCFELGWCRRLEWARPYVEAPRILVEAKSVMPTVGELMRQIQLYRTAFSGKFVVVSPDESYAQILAEQGVTFIKYKP